ncbi:MAG: hypothetical protein B5766_10725 [Candidatus Lumbricidophila eiseniae]|uniref:Uncharacterized protein n=1 Tax=Candidatus Lumbricidiphila eiseniae TaxID=1969409 RepID=A0A2A6FPA4_9MICO|nr:MAG: hypothetical protein B5766_10725 [Candidatus Lumbricidophila eiseniae]
MVAGKLIGGRGRVLVIVFKVGGSTSDVRQRGVEDRFKAHSGIIYLGVRINDSDPVKAASIVLVSFAVSSEPVFR